MVETPGDKRLMKGRKYSDVAEGRRHTFDLCQGFPLFRAGIDNPDALERLNP
jgi:hypothetical protein